MLDDEHPCPHCRGAGETQVARERTCHSCGGTGRDRCSSTDDPRFGTDTCRACHGYGVETSREFQLCPSCNGRGSIPG